MKIKSLLKKSLAFGFLSLFFSLTFSFLAGEFVVKHIFPQDTYQIARMVGLHFFQESPIIPFTLKKNVKNFHHIGYTHEFDHYVSTNSWGIRGKEFKKEKDPNTSRILCLGDSMTFGFGVEDNENYPFLLEQELNNYAKSKKIEKKFEVINAGFTDGTTLDSFYVYLKEIGMQFNPDLIILNLFPYNDFSDLTEMSWEKTDEKGYPTKIVSLKEKVEDGYIASRKKTNWKYEIPFFRNSHLAILFFNALEKGSWNTVLKIKKILGVVEEKEEFTLEERLKCIYSTKFDDCPSSLLKAVDTSKFLFQGFKEFSKEKNKDLLVTIMPSPDQAVPLSKKEEKEKILPEAQPQRYFRNFFKEEGVTFLDLLPTLSQQNAQKFFYLRDGHLNKEGHLEVARTLFKFVQLNDFNKELSP